MSKRKRVEKRRWFVDEDLLGLALTLERAGIDIVYPGHSCYPCLPRRVSDEEWIRIAAKNAWPAFTHDKRILRGNSAVSLLRNVPAVVFFLLSQDESTWHYVRMVAKHWDTVAAKLRQAEAGGKRLYTINSSRVTDIQV